MVHGSWFMVHSKSRSKVAKLKRLSQKYLNANGNQIKFSHSVLCEPFVSLMVNFLTQRALNILKNKTLFGFEFADLLSGAALTETVLAYPGLGRLTLEAVQSKDMNLVMASLMLGAFMLIVGNLLADILLKIADPRITLE